MENLNYIGNVLCVLHSKNWAFGQIEWLTSFIPLFLNCHTRIYYFYRTIKRERSRKATSLLIRCMNQETKPCFVSMRTVLHLSTYLTPTECGRRSVTSNCMLRNWFTVWQSQLMPRCMYMYSRVWHSFWSVFPLPSLAAHRVCSKEQQWHTDLFQRERRLSKYVYMYMNDAIHKQAGVS